MNVRELIQNLLKEDMDDEVAVLVGQRAVPIAGIAMARDVQEFDTRLRPTAICTEVPLAIDVTTDA